jgi:membrane protein YqaA with SNARE-associated domain
MTASYLSIFLAGSLIWKWLHRLGGPGLILIGVVDNSFVPIPGGMDLFLILLAAHRPSWWPYYAFMAVVGAVFGGFLTYRLAEKGGEETLEKKIGKQRAEKVYKRFKEHGFLTTVVGAILPPPFPIVAFLLAAGALHYPRKHFIAALSLGRAVRFFSIAFLAHIYGTAITHWLSRYYKPVLYALITLGVLAGIATLLYFKWYRPKIQQEQKRQGNKVEEFPVPFQSEEKRRRAR